MNRNVEEKLQEIERIQSFVSSSSDTTDIPRKSIDPSAEVAEPHLFLEENAFPRRSTIVQNDGSKRIDAPANTWKKQQQQQSQKSSPPSGNQKPVPFTAVINTQSSPDPITSSIPSEQHARRTVTFDDNKNLLQSMFNRSIHVSHISPRLSNHDLMSDDQGEQETVNTIPLSNITVDSDPTNLTTQDFNTLFAEDEYIPGGFANLDPEFEEELLNDFADEFDDQTIRRKQHVSSIHSIDLMNTARSPIELWQRARLLIAIHLYQIQTKALHLHDNAFATPMIMDPTMTTTITDSAVPGELDEFEKLLQQQGSREEQRVIFGLSIIQKFSLNIDRKYQCVDFYDVEQGYIIICNVVHSNRSDDQSNPEQLPLSTQSNNSQLLVYPINKKPSNEIPSVEFQCPHQFHFMICIPIFRIILGFVNIKAKKSLMVLLGDASRKGIFLSKQEIPDHIYSILYIHETNMLFIGCMGRVLLYNTQPLQYTSQPLFTSELSQLPFQSMEPVIHLCQIINHRSIGILSTRYFVLFQYAPTQNCLMKFCNPSQYDMVRCHHNSKYDYLILAFLDGLILIYQLNPMKQIRRYQHHWQMITDLKNSQDERLLLSSSLDQIINVWNLETLQHLYRYNANEEIFQIDIIEENLFYYRTCKTLVLFQLNLRTLLFAITNTKVISLKLFSDTQRTARLIALLEDYSSILISPVSGCCLTYLSNLSKKPIRQIIHDISRSTLYSLQFDGEIILYHAHHNPCVAEYKIQTKSPQYAITCMTLINPMRTHLVNINTMQTSGEKSLEKQAIFFGHTNGYISLFQADSFLMQPIQAHKNAIVCLETSRASMDKSNIFFTNCEILLSCSIDRVIYFWDLTMNKSNESIELIHLLTVEQEKNISLQSIKYLSMIDQFLVANYSDQNYLHLWQILNISVRLNDYDQWGIVEHPTKGKAHHGQIQAISGTSKFKFFASSDTEGVIKIWDSTNSLLREISVDQTLCAMEFLPSNGELIIAYQNNLHLILPEHYLLKSNKFQNKQQMSSETIAEDRRLEITQSLNLPYESLPTFDYRIKTHHSKKRLQRFERQLAGRYAVIESDHSESDLDTSPLPSTDHLSLISDDPNWSYLADEVKDILRMKKYQIREQNK